MTNILATALLFSALSVSAHGQEVSCRATADCSDTTDLGLMAAEDCCVNTPDALGFSVGEICSPCIVFGFLEDSFTGVEQGQSHSVQVGYRKGADSAQANRVFNVLHEEGTAHEGASNDYTIITNRVTVQLPNQEPAGVQFIFRSDSIAQETNETFTLRLEQVDVLTGDGVFFMGEMNMVILDSDSVNIFFTEDDFRANEGGQVPVMVAKSSRIATRIVLEVVPLRVEQAMNTIPLSLPENIPVNNSFSPPYADLKDFNNTVITITFDPDEDTNDDERATPIPVFDDPINEATEQAFIVQLKLIESVNQSAVILTTRPTSLCRIVDNDIIRIGFEQGRYTYMEPMFDVTVDQSFVEGSGPVNLVKQDGVVSEQTFEVVVQVTSSVPPGTNFQPATFGEDYSVGSLITMSELLQFQKDAQKISVPITLFADNNVEGTEAFLMTSAPGGTIGVVPQYISPTTLSTDAFVIIEDDDITIRIGFEERDYTVDESVGTFDVYVRVFDPPDEQDLPLTIDLTIDTTARTAGEADYQQLSAQSLSVFLTFNNATRRQSFPVTIIDDDISELTENFVIELRFDPFRDRPVGIELSPNMSTITIDDTDSGPLVSFERESYTALESQDYVEVCFSTSRGHTQPIEVEIQPMEKKVDNPASADNDFSSSPITQTFQASDTGNRLCANITLIRDILYEGDEQFLVTFGNLPNPDAGVGPINETTITILDDEVPRFNIGPNITVNESTPEVEICISTTSPLARNFVVTAVTGPKSGAINQATEDVDYVNATIMLTFEPRDEGTIEMCAKVGIIDDMLGNEPDEVFSVRLVNVASAGSAEACITIEDNDKPVVEWEIPEFIIPEGEIRQICFTTDIGTATSYDVQVGTRQKNPNPATSNDYEIQPSPQVFTIPVSSSGGRFCVNVTINSDEELEGNEQFLLNFANLPSEFATVGDIDTVCVTITDTATPPPPMLVDTCLITEPLRVKPFSRNTMYGFMGTCEHTALRFCDLIPGFNVRVNVDFLTESMENGAVGLLVNELRYVSKEDGSFDDGGQTPLSSTTTRREYESSGSRIVINLGEGMNNITYSVIDLPEDDPMFVEITVVHVYDNAYNIHTVAGENPLIQINVEATNDTLLKYCGLCGSQNGDLVRPDGSIAQRMNLAAVQSFAQSYLVEPREQILRPQRRECGTVRNDTVIGDPLYTVPVYNEAGKEYSLCYEVFGHTNSTLNLVSDTCVNVNARYSAMNNPELGNIISSIGVRAKGMASNSCHNIRVDLAGCSATIESPGSDPLPLTNMQNMQVDGISVKKYPSRVRISAPNCENVRLVTWVICENRNNQDMIKFVIARGVNLRASSHGLLGQFWNIPVTFTKYNGTDLPDDYDPEDIHVVKVQPKSGPARSFLGEFYHLTWDNSRKPCLYVGTSQGGPTYEVEDPNDSIIEGDYRDYIIDNGDLFKTAYKYAQFDEGRC